MKKPRTPRLAPAPNARAAALEVLLADRPGSAYVQELLDEILTATPLSPLDRRLTTQLVYGVLRRRDTLDTLLGPLVARPRRDVEPWLWNALRLGAYQLVLLAHIPPHAALHETVELANLRGRPKAKGFLNGVLRALSRRLTDERTSEPAADAVPLEEGGYRRFAQPVLPDPAVAPLEYVAQACALPLWLVQRWGERCSFDELLRRGLWFARPAPLWLRVNPLRTTRDAFLARLAAQGVSAQPGTHPQAVRLEQHAAIRDLPGYGDGLFTVQDESAMRVASAVAPRPGWQVLDLCAAPGGKTTHLAELMHNEGRVVACDLDAERLVRVSEQAGRLGLGIIETRPLDGQQLPEIETFDALLVDVPCSNTGVLNRRPEARWRLRPESLRQLAELQRPLLIQGSRLVRPGGVLVYSTCSIEPEENQEMARSLLREVPGFVLEAEEEQSAGRPADGGYWARFRRVSMPQQTGEHMSSVMEAS
jgi:16S rRNA (cytosine967-C5)-methyltransferase